MSNAALESNVVREAATNTPELLRSLLMLPTADREQLAIGLLKSLDESSDKLDAVQSSWREEIKRRWEEYKSGRSKTYSPEEVDAYLRESLK